MNIQYTLTFVFKKQCLHTNALNISLYHGVGITVSGALNGVRAQHQLIPRFRTSTQNATNINKPAVKRRKNGELSRDAPGGGGDAPTSLEKEMGCRDAFIEIHSIE